VSVAARNLHRHSKAKQRRREGRGGGWGGGGRLNEDAKLCSQVSPEDDEAKLGGRPNRGGLSGWTSKTHGRAHRGK